ncbi:MAG: FAD-binding oxidoreductase [Actinomycetota bacterium]|nr:FAD-binding oxidoreductase [Actinomycetota bacterium]MDD5668097.1 FAD-binding oxidoreductase [Actinomycetota bacterium]
MTSETMTQSFETISDEAYRDLEAAVGAEYVSREPGVLDGYTWQPTINDDPAKWVKRPVAVVLPSCTEEVQEVVRACNRHGLKFKAFSTGWGVYSGCTYDNVVQVDLRRMNRILEIDEKNMYAVIEPYNCGAQLQAEAMKLGLNAHIIGAGPACSPLASATSGWGVGWDGVYMSYGHRNLLGAEWVLPDGEVLRVGSLDSGLGWFSPDGPGPSLRGIMRGSAGALGGLGIFTKCSLKLYNWPGPPHMKTEGVMLDAQTEPPEHMRFHLCFFPDRASLDEAVYKMGESELAYIFTRTAVGAYVNTFAPHLLQNVSRTRAFRDVLSKTLKWGCTIILVGNSEDEIVFQEAVLKEIVSGQGGLSMETMQAAAIGPMMVMNFLRVSAIPMVFRAGGLFSTALARNEAWDTQMDWAEKGEKIKQRWIDRGGILDDLADNPFMALYEQNTWGHCEEIFQYNARDPKHLASLEPLFVEFSVAAMEMCMEPLSVTDARLREVISPMMGHYNEWQKKISLFLDARRAADTGMYCDEVDIDLSKIDPEIRETLDRMVAKLTWSEEGPPS